MIFFFIFFIFYDLLGVCSWFYDIHVYGSVRVKLEYTLGVFIQVICFVVFEN